MEMLVKKVGDDNAISPYVPCYYDFPCNCDCHCYTNVCIFDGPTNPWG